LQQYNLGAPALRLPCDRNIFPMPLHMQQTLSRGSLPSGDLDARLAPSRLADIQEE
jgi:hypothetical protein